MIQQPLEKQQLPLCPFHDCLKSLNSLFNMGFCIKFARTPPQVEQGEVICCASRDAAHDDAAHETDCRLHRSSLIPYRCVPAFTFPSFSLLGWVFLVSVTAGQGEALKEIVQVRLVEKQPGTWVCY